MSNPNQPMAILQSPKTETPNPNGSLPKNINRLKDLPKVPASFRMGRYTDYNRKYSVFAFCTESGVPFYISVSKNLSMVLQGPKSPAMQKFHDEPNAWIAVLYSERLTGDPNQRDEMAARMSLYRDYYANPILMMRRGRGKKEARFHSYKGAGVLTPGVKKALQRGITIPEYERNPMATALDPAPQPEEKPAEPEQAAETHSDKVVVTPSVGDTETTPSLDRLTLTRANTSVHGDGEPLPATAPVMRLETTNLVIDDPKNVKSQIEFARKSGWDVESVSVESKVITTLYLVKKTGA